MLRHLHSQLFHGWLCAIIITNEIKCPSLLMRGKTLLIGMEFRPFVFIAIHRIRAYDSIFGGKPSLLLGPNVSGLLLTIETFAILHHL